MTEALDELLGLIIALAVYTFVRWVQHRWPDPAPRPKRSKSKDDKSDDKSDDKEDDESGDDNLDITGF